MRSTRDRVIVVGSGPPGATAALFLARAGIDVLLLEGGPRRAALGLTARVGGLTVFRVHRQLRKREGTQATADPKAGVFEELAPGGLSNHWSCAVPRFAEEDFLDARRAGEAYEWPIGYRDLAPWYERVEPLLHIAGTSESSERLPAGVVGRARELRRDWDGPKAAARDLGRALVPMPYAYGAETTVTFSGTAFNSFVRLLEPALRAGLLEVRYDAIVSRLEASPNGGVGAVVCRDRATGAEERVPCRAVVLAAGAVGTAEILLSSANAEFPAGLGNTHGVLGHYLHDHPLGKVTLKLDRPLSIFPSAYLTRPDLGRSPPLYAAACMQWSGVELLARSLLARTAGKLRWVGFNVFGTMAPVADNWVGLGSTRRADGRPSLVLNIRLPPEAAATLERTRDDLVAVLQRSGIGAEVGDWQIAPVFESVHYGGTCRMHASPRFGMVDARSRLHAVRNVAVADSSVFTTGPEKNPVVTSMALAARAAEALAGDIKAGDL